MRYFLFLDCVSFIEHISRQLISYIINVPAHEIMALFVLRKLILQTRIRSHPVVLDV